MEETGPEVQVAPRRLGSFKLEIHEDLISSEDDSGVPEHHTGE
jgi:hypothetical protein